MRGLFHLERLQGCLLRKALLPGAVLLPLLPVLLARLQPSWRSGQLGQGKAGCDYRGVQRVADAGGVGLFFCQAGGQALCLRLQVELVLLQTLLLVLGIFQRLLRGLGLVFGALCGALAGFGRLQCLAQHLGLLCGGLLGLFQRFWVLPSVVGERGICGLAQAAPARLPLRELGLDALQLALLAAVFTLPGRVLGAQLFALALQLFQLHLRGLHGGFGGRYIERRVSRNGRVFVRSAQRAGFTRLQGVALFFQALDALLLREQLALVGQLFFLRLELAAQRYQIGFLLLQACGEGLQTGLQLLGLLRHRLALLHMVLQLLPAVQVLLSSLPV